MLFQRILSIINTRSQLSCFWWLQRVCVLGNICGESWLLVGNSCLKLITAKDSYDNAKLACRSHQAVLASLTTQKKVQFVLKEMYNRSLQVSLRHSFTVFVLWRVFFYEFVTCVLQGTSLCEALHTLNWTEYELYCVLQSKAVITPWVGLRKINVSYWCWEDMSPFTNSTLQWLPGEPSDAGFCGYLAEPTFNGLKAATCVNSVNGSLCERPSEKMHIHTHIDNNK